DADPGVAERHAQALAATLAADGIAGLALPALLLSALPGATLDALQAVLAYGEHPHVVAQAARRLRDASTLRYLPSFCVGSWVGPLAFWRAAGGWRVHALARPYPHPVVLGRFDDLADLHQAGRLCLL